MKLQGMFVAGVGVHLPDVFSVDEAVERGLYDAEEAMASGWTGALVAGDLPAPDMAVRAGRQALARSGHQPTEVAILMHADTLHQGPDLWPPQSYIQRHVIGGNAPAVEIRQSCNAMLAAMELSSCFLGTAAQPAALITAADNFGHPLFDRWRYASKAGTNRLSIAGDAAAAVVLSRADGFARLLAIGSTSLPELEATYRGGVELFPPEPTLGRQPRMGERLAHHRNGDPTGFQAAKKTLAETRTTLGERTLAEAGVRPEEVTRVVHVFSGGQPYITSVLEPLGIDPSRCMLEFGRGVGHLAACDQIVGLEHLVTTAQVGPGDHVLLLSNGGGSLACAVVEITSRPPWADHRQHHI
jgi:3-oxoacyl-[acyl-carrier-protein] synthase-3